MSLTGQFVIAGRSCIWSYRAHYVWYLCASSIRASWRSPFSSSPWHTYASATLTACITTTADILSTLPGMRDVFSVPATVSCIWIVRPCTHYWPLTCSKFFPTYNISVVFSIKTFWSYFVSELLLLERCRVVRYWIKSVRIGILENENETFMRIHFWCRVFILYHTSRLFSNLRPLMLNTQRLSSLAYNLRDGSETDASKLTLSMKRLGIK